MDKAEELMEDGYAVFVFFPSWAEREKFLKLTENRTEKGMVHVIGELFESTVLHDFKIALLTEENSAPENEKPGRLLWRKRYTLCVSYLVQPA